MGPKRCPPEGLPADARVAHARQGDTRIRRSAATGQDPVRRDHVDHWGSVTLRYRRKLHHISVGRPHRHKRVLILMADLDVRVIDEDGVLLRHFELDPTRDYQARSRSSL